MPRKNQPHAKSDAAPAPVPARLVDLPDAALWSSRSWTTFARQKNRHRTLVLVPVFGFADWGLGRPLDLEEILGSAVLRAALPRVTAARLPLLTLPPVRFVAGPYPHCTFGLDFETAHELLRELGASIRESGFRRIVFFNTSPWNREVIDSVARDLRINRGLQTFFVHLAALGLDLHPTNSITRDAVQHAACALLGTGPEEGSVAEDVSLRDFRPAHIRQPAPLSLSIPLAQSIAAGHLALDAAGRSLAELLTAMAARPPLARDGAIVSPTPPSRGRRSRSAR